MSGFSIGALRNSSVWSVYRIRDRIKMDPVYQREGDIWTLEKRQLLIDTILNGFDVPKLYMHKFRTPELEDDSTYEYAMIDGKQRLNAIFSFIEGGFALDSKFEYQKADDIHLAGLTYNELSKHHPDIKADFDSYTLDVVTVETDDLEVIEDLFSRLNEAVPLNAAEKRNAKPGPLPRMVRQLAQSDFFTQKLPFDNRRYRHFDIAAKLLLMASREGVADTKKAYVDRFFESNANSSEGDVASFTERAVAVTSHMSEVFVDRDVLLRSVGMISVYFLLFERAMEKECVNMLDRTIFEKFEEDRVVNRKEAEVDIAQANYQLLEFDRFAQSPNDGIALRYRVAVIDNHLFGGRLGFSDDTVLSECNS